MPKVTGQGHIENMLTEHTFCILYPVIMSFSSSVHHNKTYVMCNIPDS